MMVFLMLLMMLMMGLSIFAHLLLKEFLHKCEELLKELLLLGVANRRVVVRRALAVMLWNERGRSTMTRNMMSKKV